MAALELPIFPLPLVLFPGAHQPLHIFEPRYRKMLADALAGESRFGISLADPASDPDAAPQPGDAGCVAHVLSCQQLPDGRSNIMTRGETRYTLSEYVATDLPYRIARVELFDDDAEPGIDLDQLTGQVREAFGRADASLRILNDAVPVGEIVPTDAKALSFHVAAAISLETSLKQKLLTLRSTRMRLELLQRVVQPLATELAKRASVHQGARRNGHGRGEHAGAGEP